MKYLNKFNESNSEIIEITKLAKDCLVDIFYDDEIEISVKKISEKILIQIHTSVLFDNSKASLIPKYNDNIKMFIDLNSDSYNIDIFIGINKVNYLELPESYRNIQIILKKK